MSDMPLAKTTVKTAEPLVPRRRPRKLVRAKPLTDTVLASTSDTGIQKRAAEAETAGPIVIYIEASSVATSAAATWAGFHSGASVAACVFHLILHEAPAWTVSMVVHMVTLVTMAMVTVPQPVLYKSNHLLVTPPPVEEKIEEVKEANNEKPTTLEENAVTESVAFDSKVEQERVNIQPSNEPEAAPAAIDLADYGLDRVPKSDLLATVGVYGGTGLSGRELAAKAQLVTREGGSETSEKAVSTALKWLANHQMPDGGWNFNHTNCPGCRGQCRNAGTLAEARNAATGLALLPFLGTGQTHRDGQYKTTIKNGLSYLVTHMRIGPQGGALNENGGNMYSHGIAAIALCEAYAMTHDRGLLPPAQAALNYVSYAQDPIGGGWRYKPREKGDTSVVGWQLMALKSGYMANLRVSTLTVHRASLFLDGIQSDDGAAYGYAEAGKQGEATTAIGLLCRMYLGWKRDNPSLQRGVKFLSGRGPSGANMYYNYYATQVMRHWEGEEWTNWNRQMRDQLIHAQAKQGHEDGSWFTGSGDNGAAPGGRLYCTAMATMILEVYYRHMPIYRAQRVDQDFPD